MLKLVRPDVSVERNGADEAHIRDPLLHAPLLRLLHDELAQVGAPHWRERHADIIKGEEDLVLRDTKVEGGRGGRNGGRGEGRKRKNQCDYSKVIF